MDTKIGSPTFYTLRFKIYSLKLQYSHLFSDYYYIVVMKQHVKYRPGSL